MRGVKKQQQKKRKCRTKQTVKATSSKRINNAKGSSRIVTKNFEIFVTDFLTDPHEIPVDLKDCVLIDGTTPFNESSDNSSSNSGQVLKKIYANNEPIDRIVPLIVEESSIKLTEVEPKKTV